MNNTIKAMVLALGFACSISAMFAETSRVHRWWHGEGEYSNSRSGSGHPRRTRHQRVRDSRVTRDTVVGVGAGAAAGAVVAGPAGAAIGAGTGGLVGLGLGVARAGEDDDHGHHSHHHRD